MKMYTTIISLTFGALFFLSCKPLDENKSTNKSIVKNTLFKQQTTGKYTTWLELKQDEDSIYGIVYGVEDQLYGISPLFYKSDIENLEIKSNRIEFVLKQYQFSDKTFEPGRFNQSITIVDTNKVVMPDYYFQGTLSSDTLLLLRMSDYHDSKADAFTFIKVPQ